MKYIVGTKVGMIRLFETNGKSVPATVIHCEPNVVLENKTKEKNGCSGIKIGYKNTKENKKNRAHNGIFKKLNLPTQHYIRTFTSVDQAYQVSDKINVDTFKVGEYVDVQGVTKGHGFTGAIKRWNFKIGPLSHGGGYPHRLQGSIAMGRGGSQAQRVAKGKKMHGHYGHETVTVQNLQVLLVNGMDNIIAISGAVPGPKGSLVTIKSSYKCANMQAKVDLISKSKQVEIQKENEQLEDKDALHKINEEIDAKEALAEEKEAAEAAAAASAKAKAAKEEGEKGGDK